MTPDGVWAGFQLSILKAEQSGLWTRIGYGKRFIVRADEKLTAFIELERVTRESFLFSNADKSAKSFLGV